MSLNVQRNRTTFSCSFRIGAIFTKNHTGVPESIKRTTRIFSRIICLFSEKCRRVHVSQKSWLHSVNEMFWTFPVTPASEVGGGRLHLRGETNTAAHLSGEAFSGLALNQLAHFYRGRNVPGCLWTQLYVTDALNTFALQESVTSHFFPPSFLPLLTVLLVHQYFKRVHLIILER